MDKLSGPSRERADGARVPASEEEAALVLAASRGVGPAAASALRARFGSYRCAVSAAFGSSGGGMPGGLAAAIRRAVEGSAAHEELRLARAFGARFAVPGTADYPDSLAAIARPPVGIYVAGRAVSGLLPALAVVGTRTATRRGLAVARDLAFDVATLGLTVVSGLARGIDTAAHEGALEAGGTTIAVLGAGLMCTYPSENEGLATRIRSAGALVSEYPMRQRPCAGSFPARNRLIAGLSSGVLVVEAGSRSGALITAARALEEGREVFAVPGPITEPLSAGPNGLIKAGAKLVEDAGDILEELRGPLGMLTGDRGTGGWSGGGRPEAASGAQEVGGTPDGELRLATKVVSEEIDEVSRVREQLSGEPRTVDELSALSGLPASVVASALLELELSGRASACAGGRYANPGGRAVRRHRGRRGSEGDVA